MRIYTLLKNIFKIAKLLSTNDDGALRFANVSMLGKEQKVMLFTPYGLMSSPPLSSLCLVWSQNGQESNGVAMADDPKNRTLKSLAVGEVAIGNYETDNYLYFDKNGKATLVCEDLDVLVTDNCLITSTEMDIQVANDIVITATNITATCTDECNINAVDINLTATGDITLGAAGVLGLSGATMSMSAGGATMGIDGSGNMSINSTSLQHNSTNIGDTHYHTQGNDSGGDTEPNTSGPN